MKPGSFTLHSAQIYDKNCVDTQLQDITNMSEKLCLQWNDFQDNIKSAFGNLREDNDFADVTLACEDGQQVEAHKVILAASSPFFQKLLGRNKHPHPLIYMRGMKSDDLSSIVDFLYRGEANVYQENLDSFLAIAEELQLKGLMGRAVENMEDADVEQEDKPHPVFERSDNIPMKLSAESERTVAVTSNFSGDLLELEERVKSMMQISQNLRTDGRQKAYTCKVCGKEGSGSTIINHIESNHLEGIAIPCNLCGGSFRSRNSLRCHMQKHKMN